MLGRIGVRLALLLTASLATIGRADDPKPMSLSGGGEYFDLDGDCQINVEKGTWQLKKPTGVCHDLWPKKGKVNAPRLLQDARRNFRVEVKIPGSITAEKDTAIPAWPAAPPFAPEAC
jgi:hypothetical protein